MRNKHPNKTRLQELEISLPGRMKQLHRLLEKWAKHDYLPTVDRNKRLHTLLTQMPEPIRHFVSFENERLAAVDLKNSQPFHLCYLFSQRFWESKTYAIGLRSILPALYKELNRHGVLTQIRRHIKACSHRSDVHLFIEKTTQGYFYECLVEKYGEQRKRLSTRQKAKQRFMVFMNFDTAKKNSVYYKDYREWANDFPAVARLLELIKQLNYTYLSKILQALEAKMLLSRVVGEFVKKHPDVLITSIHDSLVTLDTQKKELEAILKRVYQRELKLVPNVEAKTLRPENAYRDLPKYIKKKLNS